MEKVRRTSIPEYSVWTEMKQRCHNPRNTGYSRYGGRGIVVCDEWRENFDAFYDYMGPRPSPNHSIDRINNDGDYEPGNVRWATAKEQAANKRPCQPSLGPGSRYVVGYLEMLLKLGKIGEYSKKAKVR